MNFLYTVYNYTTNILRINYFITGPNTNVGYGTIMPWIFIFLLTVLAVQRKTDSLTHNFTGDASCLFMLSSRTAWHTICKSKYVGK